LTHYNIPSFINLLCLCMVYPYLVHYPKDCSDLKYKFKV
jgi:hypothetical protein